MQSIKRSERGIGRRAMAAAVALLAVGVAVAPVASAATRRQQATHIVAIAQKALQADHLNAVILRVTVDNKPVVTRALGISMTGVPATTAMHFRNGSVSFSYLTTLLMRYVDQHKVTLNDTVARWLPKLPDANLVTLKMLANMTSGYPDYVTNPTFINQFYANPFHLFTNGEKLALAFRRPVSFTPGTNWGYAHTNMVILGQILAKVGHKPLATLLRQQVLNPLGLKNTVASQTGSIPSPVLHAFTSERRQALGIPAKTPFYEESSFWNPAWTTPAGAAETTNIYDMATTAAKIGSGALLTKASYQAQTGPNLLGFGHPQSGCACIKQTSSYNFGLGIVRSGSWLLETPSFAGYASAEAYLPSKKIAIAIATTNGAKAYNAQGDAPNFGDPILRAIGAYMAPSNRPPTPR